MVIRAAWLICDVGQKMQKLARFAFFLFCASAGACELPNWQFDMARYESRFAGRVVQSAVLAWRIDEDLEAHEGELRRREVCILALQRAKSESERSWTLFRLARARGDEWQLSPFSTHLPFPMLDKRSKPTEEEISRFFADWWWPAWRPLGDFRTIDSGICDDALEIMFGIKPGTIKRPNKAPEPTSTRTL